MDIFDRHPGRLSIDTSSQDIRDSNIVSLLVGQPHVNPVQRFCSNILHSYRRPDASSTKQGKDVHQQSVG